MIFVRTLSIATIGAAFVSLGTIGSAQAAELNLNASGQGWWSATVPNKKGNNSYFVGEYVSGKPVRNFFTFDISALKNEPPVESLTLELRRYKGVGNKNLTIKWSDVSTSAKTLNNNSGKSRKIFNDLGNDRSYGTSSRSTSGNPSGTLDFSLNANAVIDINRASGRFFSIGGAITPKSLRSGGRQGLFGSSGTAGVQRLRVEVVPEPSSVIGVLGFGAFGLSWMLKRRQKLENS